MTVEHSATIENACRLIAAGDLVGASSVISAEYPFSPRQNPGRNYTPIKMTRVFLRDGFVDRYRGTRLVFPPVLRLLSHYLPEDFPYHKNGMMTKGHMAYWELFPTIDHVVPVARGGAQPLPDFTRNASLPRKRVAPEEGACYCNTACHSQPPTDAKTDEHRARH